VANVAAEISARQIAVYSVESRGDVSIARIENISKAISINNAKFMFRCTDPYKKECFKVDANGESGLRQGNAIAIPPLFPGDVTPEITARFISITTTLIANSVLEVELYPKQVGDSIDFFYVPNNSNPVNILFLKDRGIEVWFLRNYFLLLIYGAFIAAGLLMISVMISLVQLLLRPLSKSPN
jgi:hypothetical protein